LRLSTALRLAGLSLIAIVPRLAWAEPLRTGPHNPSPLPDEAIDGATGLPIPCRCLYQGKSYELGDVVCMRTHVGIVMTRCERFLNHTAWMPTSEPCTISGSPRGPATSLQGTACSRDPGAGGAPTCGRREGRDKKDLAFAMNGGHTAPAGARLNGGHPHDFRLRLRDRDRPLFFPNLRSLGRACGPTTGFTHAYSERISACGSLGR
jgi:hypothetical protein